jgi:hypothetical protein
VNWTVFASVAWVYLVGFLAAMRFHEPDRIEVIEPSPGRPERVERRRTDEEIANEVWGVALLWPLLVVGALIISCFDHVRNLPFHINRRLR